MATGSEGQYYIPHTARWPIVGSIGLTSLVVGFSLRLNGNESTGDNMMLTGLAITVIMMLGWFGEVIKESEGRFYNAQVDISFRQGMGWFILSEVMFFAAFFGALYYARIYSVPWVGGEGAGAVTNAVLWADYEAAWPTNGPEAIGGQFQAMGAWGLPAINTLILLTSGITCTWAHHGILKGNRGAFIFGLFLTVLLGFIFVGLQVVEYMHGYQDLNLTLGSGLYGSTFYMLTGFHGFHVTVGAIMLLVMMIRAMRGHFTSEHHFGFEGAAWYWHFVDVVWLGLFIFVYWL